MDAIPMYVVTGGAGFIGSHVVAALAARRQDVVVCDWLRSDERWRNLAKHEIADIVAPEDLADWLRGNQAKVEAVIHMGAISSTTETDVDLITLNNVRATLSLLRWCTETETRFIYASSAATYGDGARGFDDAFSCDALALLPAQCLWMEQTCRRPAHCPSGRAGAHVAAAMGRTEILQCLWAK
jgi:ADP-L-glycero-D-manno-heptose 6-epimerase